MSSPGACKVKAGPSALVELEMGMVATFLFPRASPSS